MRSDYSLLAEEFSSASRSVKPGLVCTGIVCLIIASDESRSLTCGTIGLCLDMERNLNGLFSGSLSIWCVWRLVVRRLWNVSSSILILFCLYLNISQGGNYFFLRHCFKSQGERQRCPNIPRNCQGAIRKSSSSHVPCKSSLSNFVPS